MTTWTFNSDGTATFATGYGDITVIDEFLDNGYFGDDLADISTSHPNYHEYSTTYNLGYSFDQVDLKIVQDALAAFPTPTSQTFLSPSAYGIGGWSFAGPGYVTHHWTNPSTVLNVTTDLHVLDPGVVQREIVVIDGQYHIRTIGNGIGVQPQINVAWAAGVWGFTDMVIGGYILNATGILPTEPGHTNVNGQHQHCFKSDTPIQMWPFYPSIKPRPDGIYDEHLVLSGARQKPISEIKLGDTVLAFDPAADLGRGGLVPRKVVRLYRNTTEEWVTLTWSEGGEAKELVATPGHHFLDQFGNFPTIEEMLENGQATVVLNAVGVKLSALQSQAGRPARHRPQGSRRAPMRMRGWPETPQPRPPRQRCPRGPTARCPAPHAGQRLFRNQAGCGWQSPPG